MEKHMRPSDQLGPGIRRYDWLGEYSTFGGLVVEDRESALDVHNTRGVDKVPDVFQLICEKQDPDLVTTGL